MKKIVACFASLAAIGATLGVVAYFAKAKSMEEPFDTEGVDASAVDDMSDDMDETTAPAERTYTVLSHE